MATLTNDERKKQKRETIITSGRRVFQQKGFLDVTMKDIIEAANISRGGIYLYFHSVDEVFVAVLNKRNSHSLEEVKQDIVSKKDFDLVLQDYFDGQRDRLLSGLNDSLLRAVYEYYFTHKRPEDQAFQAEQFAMIKQTITTILEFGIAQNVLRDSNLNNIAEHIMFLIEGLSVLALTSGVTPQQVDDQFDLIEAMLPRTASETRR